MAPGLLVATTNQGKVAEFERLLGPCAFRLIATDPRVEEVGESYSENALLKAEAASAQADMPALGDDSGLEVEALGGYPGLHSARIAPSDRERIALLWRRLRESGRPRPWRARFVCVIALAAPGRRSQVYRGECEGEIVTPARGRSGFGYDPVFVPEGSAMTLAELGPAYKDVLGHRALAARRLIESGGLESILGRSGH